IRPEVTETTAMGACYLAGLAVGYWSSLDEVKRQWKAERTFKPSGAPVTAAREGWKDAIKRTVKQ
ncbi:MAG: glycerol kinase, partial [Bacteroidales bacterium]|nr:glycerol kinase [Bacteroidales bacterium]